MFTKHIFKINHLLDEKSQQDFLRNSINELPRETSRSKATTRRSCSTPRPKYTSRVKIVREDIPKKYVTVLEALYRAKCASLAIDFNQKNLETFLKAFSSKNKLDSDQLCFQAINLTDFGLGEACLPFINQLLRQNPSIVIIKLSKNEINPNNLLRIQTLKELSLGNCKLGNEVLQLLFQRLHTSCIQKLSLSSPQIKNRNILTRYKTLLSLIQTTNTLNTLELANMDIQPNSMIIETCKNTTIKHLNLSDNNLVKGICSTLHTLNLSRNGIIVPFTYPMLPNDMLVLDLSYNKIPNTQFRQFLKFPYFPNLKQLKLDHIKLEGDLTCLQYFLQQSAAITNLSMVNCNLNQNGFLNIAHGVKHSHSLEILNLSCNKIPNQKVADYISHMLQGSPVKEIKLKNCDIKDSFGEIIFKNFRRCKNLEKINLMNNLLGDRTAKAICNQLKFAKSIVSLQLQENIIKYSDIHEINSYLESNKYFNGHQLDKEYKKLLQTNKQIIEASIILNSEAERLAQLQRQTDALHLQYIAKFKVENQQRKKKLKSDIYNIRDTENQLMTDITLLQALPSLTELNSMESRKESFISNHDSFNKL